MAFSSDDVPVTMRGDEWFALLAVLNTAHIASANLSTKGERKFKNGKARLESQLLAASTASTRKPAMRGAPMAPAGRSEPEGGES